MLKITIPATEYYDETTNSFINTKEQTLQLEHSLVSLSKWESRWKKPFLTKGEKTKEQTIDYIRCMTITQNVDPIIYLGITDKIVEEVSAYIDDSMTATWFNDETQSQQSNRHTKRITSEVIYYWMIACNIPFECQKWHLNRLLTLIRVCNAYNNPKKMSKKEILARNKALNEARKAQHNTKG